MIELLIVSLLWAFSFGIIKDNLSGLDPSFVACARLGIAFLTLLPFLRLRRVTPKQAVQLISIGAVQFGIMYISYNYAFQYLKAYEVALFTVFTPIYVTLVDQALVKKVQGTALVAAFLAVIGTAIVSWTSLQSRELALGFLIVQVSNLCFAAGQVIYRRIAPSLVEVRDLEIFSLLYLGGFLITALSAIVTGGLIGLRLSNAQGGTLVYLGIVASGIGFFLWNHAARRVNTGTLAVFNNLKVPLAVTVSLLFFAEKADLAHLMIGGGIVLVGLVINEALTARSGRRAGKPAEPAEADNA